MLAPSVAPFDTAAVGVASVVRSGDPIRATALSLHEGCASVMRWRATAIAIRRPRARTFQRDAVISAPRFATRARACPMNVIRILIFPPVVESDGRRVALREPAHERSESVGARDEPMPTTFATVLAAPAPVLETP